MRGETAKSANTYSVVCKFLKRKKSTHANVMMSFFFSDSGVRYDYVFIIRRYM